MSSDELKCSDISYNSSDFYSLQPVHVFLSINHGGQTNGLVHDVRMKYITILQEISVKKLKHLVGSITCRCSGNEPLSLRFVWFSDFLDLWHSFFSRNFCVVTNF